MPAPGFLFWRPAPPGPVSQLRWQGKPPCLYNAFAMTAAARVLTLVLFFALAGTMAARAAEDEPPAPGPGRGSETSGLPLPRFASLRAGEVNVRTGPGVQYPVDWVFQRQGLPVAVIAEYRTWRKIRDWQGTQGWVHPSPLAGKRTVIVIGGTLP